MLRHGGGARGAKGMRKMSRALWILFNTAEENEQPVCRGMSEWKINTIVVVCHYIIYLRRHDRREW